MEQKLYFKEKQKTTQRWIWILMSVLLVMLLYSTYDIAIQADTPLSSEDIVFLLVGWIVISSIFLLLFLFRIDTTIDENGVSVKVYPFHLKKIKYPWSSIRRIYVREYQPIGEYGGWGIRGFGKDRAFNAKGNMGIQLELEDGRMRLIGTSKPVQAEKAIAEIQDTNLKGKFSKQAKAYSKYRPSYPNMLFQHIYTHCPSFESAWDVGCGNGQVTQVLSDKFNSVVGTDISHQQLEFAEGKKNIRYQVGPAESIELDQKFDLITVAQALHWFDRDSFYINVRKHLKPKGVFAAFGYGHARIDDQVDPIIDQLFYEILEDYWDPAIHLVKDHYRNIDFPFNEIDSPEFYHHDKWNLDQLLGFFESWSAVQEYKDKEGKDPVDIIRDDLEKAWDKRVKNIEFPVFLRMGVVE